MAQHQVRIQAEGAIDVNVDERGNGTLCQLRFFNGVVQDRFEQVNKRVEPSWMDKIREFLSLTYSIAYTDPEARAFYMRYKQAVKRGGDGRI